MKYKLVALDVDGTLLNDAHELSDSTIQIIKEIREEGASVVLCTGRGPLNAFPIMEQLGMDGPAITHNGAAIVDSSNDEVLHSFPFEHDEIMPNIAYCRQHGIQFDVCTAFEIYVEEFKQQGAKMYEQFKLSPKVIPDIRLIEEPLLKLSMYSSVEQIDRMERDWESVHPNLRMIRSGDQFIDMMNVRSTKGNALKVLSELWNITPSEIVAMGNYYNDVEMLQFAGLGIAMDNSPEGVKQNADEVTASNNEDGVCAALRKHVL